MISLVILHITVLNRVVEKSIVYEFISHFILAHFDMKYKISRKLFIFW